MQNNTNAASKRPKEGTPTMYDHELALAKRISDAHPHSRRVVAAECGASRQDFEKRLTEGAEAIRAAGETPEHAYVRFIETEVGKALFRAAMAAPARAAVQDLPMPKRPPAGEASAALERLARFEAKAKNITYELAYTRILANPANKILASRVKSEELAATRMVRDSRWPLNQAEAASETLEWVAGLDEVGRRRLRPASQ
jgi:hypothetical protein